MPDSPSPLLPPGTQVALRVPMTDQTGLTVQRGAIGRVTGQGPDGRYEVRLAGGRHGTVGREQVSLRRSYQQEIAIGAQDAGAAEDRAAWAADLVREHTVYAAVVGSRAFGLATGESDTDTRGVYVAPTAAFWSLTKPPTHVEGPAPEWFSWEVERFCELALKANPNLFEVLHSPFVVRCTDLGHELLELRPAFRSQLAYQTYSGYVLSQFKKLETDLRRDGEPKWKHVMHLLRLLLSAQHLLLTGHPQIDVGPDRERLLAIRQGATSWADVERWRLELHVGLDDALLRSPLPAGPDGVRVDQWLHSVRLRGGRQAPECGVRGDRPQHPGHARARPGRTARGPVHEEVIALAPACLTSRHARHTAASPGPSGPATSARANSSPCSTPCECCSPASTWSAPASWSRTCPP